MKKISDTMQIGIALVGLAITYATFSNKSESDKGTGGSLNVPFDLSSLFGGGSGAAVGTSQPAVSNSVQPSQTILDAMAAASISKKTTSDTTSTAGLTNWFKSQSTPILTPASTAAVISHQAQSSMTPVSTASVLAHMAQSSLLTSKKSSSSFSSSSKAPSGWTAVSGGFRSVSGTFTTGFSK